DWSEVAEDLLTDTNRLARLVDDLLLLARTDESARLARPVPVDLSALLSELAGRYPGVTVSIPDSPLWTVGEPDGLRRVLANLLDNAVRYAASSVRLTAEPAGDRVVVAVTDDGPGIPAADRNRVFERFTRLDDARGRDDGGSGLGLAIVRELVRRHDGRVRLLDASPATVPAAIPAGAGVSDGP